MLAYIFWHRPFPHVDRKHYEESIARFQRDLAAQPPPGFIAAASFRIEPVPWLSDLPGYEDWHLLEGSWALDPLNAYAVAAHMQPSHDTVAADMGEGHGGLYSHAGGETPAGPRSTVYWLTRPRRIHWRPAVDAIRAACPQATVWRRQMVLGPSPEFAVEAPADAEIAAPSGWQARGVKRVRLAGSPA